MIVFHVIFCACIVAFHFILQAVLFALIIWLWSPDGNAFRSNRQILHVLLSFCDRLISDFFIFFVVFPTISDGRLFAKVAWKSVDEYEICLFEPLRFINFWKSLSKIVLEFYFFLILAGFLFYSLFFQENEGSKIFFFIWCNLYILIWKSYLMFLCFLSHIKG